MLFIDNKYTRWYYNIINAAKSRKINSGYTENHHIIPKSLGGTNEFDNLVLLLPREHYIAHLLLIKMVNGEAKMKMSFALRCMSNFQNKYHQRYVPPSKIYEIAKKFAIAATIEKNTGHPGYLKFHTNEAREKISITMKERLSQMTADEHAIRIKNSCSSPESWTHERKNKISQALTGKILSDETRMKMSLSKQNMTLEQKMRCGDSNRGKTWKIIDGKRVWIPKEN